MHSHVPHEPNFHECHLFLSIALFLVGIVVCCGLFWAALFGIMYGIQHGRETLTAIVGLLVLAWLLRFAWWRDLYLARLVVWFRRPHQVSGAGWLLWHLGPLHIELCEDDVKIYKYALRRLPSGEYPVAWHVEPHWTKRLDYSVGNPPIFDDVWEVQWGAYGPTRKVWNAALARRNTISVPSE